ncbi:MAG: selenocysteine-specific translation elongation factor [Tissierellia bacterium]|nr:selenocysteine-specific translation elongation factor [Tissierellia bacterium]
MKHMIIGTAGHIDHGKTTLIRALTGRNTDRLIEEQKRGISIDLGFAFFNLPRGQRAGIIDVPGHEKFIKNMLAGVMGMDIILLVVAADEGVMPQTKEHLAILDLLGIEKGLIVITKMDLVDEELLELVEEEIRDEVKGTFLENSPIVRVSSTEGKGIDQLIKLLDDYVKDMEERDISDLPRMPIDRVFTISGFGTVVTGTLLSGTLRVGDEVQIYPDNLLGRIRSLQVHDEDTEVAYAGQRVAANLVGIKKDDIERGQVLAAVGQMMPTRMLDVKVKLLEGIDRTIKSRTRLRLYLGTKELFCRIQLLDREILNPGEEAYAQLRLEEETVCKRGDRFILRFYSPMFTIGGGIVLEPIAKKKKALDHRAIEELKLKEVGSEEEILEYIIKDNSSKFPSLKDIAAITSISETRLKEDIYKLVMMDRVIVLDLTKDKYLLHKSFYMELRDRIVEELKEYHESFPLRPGIKKEMIRNKYINNAPARLGDLFIQSLIEDGLIVQEFDTIRLKDFQPKMNEEQLRIKRDIIRTYEEKGFMVPKAEEILASLDYKEGDKLEVFNALIYKGELIRLKEDLYLLNTLYQEALGLLKDHIMKKGSITIAELRDLLNTNRKVALFILELFDQRKITKREDNRRILHGINRN